MMDWVPLAVTFAWDLYRAHGIAEGVYQAYLFFKELRNAARTSNQ